MKKEDNKFVKWLSGILDILICLLLFIASMYKGEFYKEDSIFISMIICMLGLVTLTIKLVLNIIDTKKVTKSKMGTILDVYAILMPISYILSIAFKTYASLEAALFESVRYVNFTIIYFIVRTSANKKIYLNSLFVIGIVIAILGLNEITYRFGEEFLNNISIYYLEAKDIKISSTLQYANITALIILISSIIAQGKLVKNVNKISAGYKTKLLTAIEIFIVIFLQSTIVLTTSRMNIFLSMASTLVYVIYLFKKNNKKEGLTLILMYIANILLVSSIDKYLVLNNYFMVILSYGLTLIISIILVLISSKINIKNIENEQKAIHLNKARKYIFIPCVLILLVGIFIPSKLKVGSSNEEVTITRNIFMNFEEQMNLNIKYSSKNNPSFNILIYEYDKGFNKKMILNISEKSFKDNTYNSDINISKDTIKLTVIINTNNSEITIDKFCLNNKDIVLSYMFMPDTIMFRIKDTFNNDSNNSLRFTYYKDSLKLFKMSPIVGLGGEGFKTRYQEVQDIKYISSEAHSVPLQILVESGIIGFTIYIAIHIIVYIALFRIIKRNNNEGIILFLIFLCLNIVSLFDIVFSYGFMINVFAIIVGLIIGEYKRNITDKDKYNLDNKSLLGMIKIIVLSISLMALIIITVYSVNMFRASILVLPSSDGEIEKSYDRVGILETKIKLDKYNVSYLTNLLTEYDSHIDLLNDIYLNSSDSENKNILRGEIDNYIVKQKEVADNLIEYEYYNKYAIEKVARCYFKRYLSYARLYSSNFKNDEISYTFYIGYAIKLTDRLVAIGPNNNTALNFAYNIYNDFLPSLKLQNKITESEMFKQAIDDIEKKMEELSIKLK